MVIQTFNFFWGRSRASGTILSIFFTLYVMCDNFWKMLKCAWGIRYSGSKYSTSPNADKNIGMCKFKKKNEYFFQFHANMKKNLYFLSGRYEKKWADKFYIRIGSQFRINIQDIPSLKGLADLIRKLWDI